MRRKAKRHRMQLAHNFIPWFTFQKLSNDTNWKLLLDAGEGVFKLAHKKILRRAPAPMQSGALVKPHLARGPLQYLPTFILLLHKGPRFVKNWWMLLYCAITAPIRTFSIAGLYCTIGHASFQWVSVLLLDKGLKLQRAPVPYGKNETKVSANVQKFNS